MQFWKTARQCKSLLGYAIPFIFIKVIRQSVWLIPSYITLHKQVFFFLFRIDLWRHLCRPTLQCHNSAAVPRSSVQWKKWHTVAGSNGSEQQQQTRFMHVVGEYPAAMHTNTPKLHVFFPAKRKLSSVSEVAPNFCNFLILKHLWGGGGEEDFGLMDGAYLSILPRFFAAPIAFFPCLPPHV